MHGRERRRRCGMRHDDGCDHRANGNLPGREWNDPRHRRSRLHRLAHGARASLGRARGRGARHARARQRRRRRRRTAGRRRHRRRGARRATCAASTASTRSSTSPPTRTSASRCASPRSTSATTSTAPCACSTRRCVQGSSQFVFSSSCSVYGTPDSVPGRRVAAIRPESVYAETKAIVERVLHWYGEVHGPAQRQPALLQRRRRQLRRPAR